MYKGVPYKEVPLYTLSAMLPGFMTKQSHQFNSLRALMRMRGITASAWFFRVRACRFVCVFILGVGPQTKPRFVLRVLESLVSS